MRDYGKIFSTFWTSDDTRALSDDGKMLALYLLAGPHTNLIGCFRLPDGYVAEDLGWSLGRVAQGFAELSRRGFATRDEGTRWVAIHKYLKWNPLENPNQAKAATRLVAQIPAQCAVRPVVERALAAFGGRFATHRVPGANPCPTLPEPGTGTGAGTEAGTEAEAKQKDMPDGGRAAARHDSPAGQQPDVSGFAGSASAGPAPAAPAFAVPEGERAHFAAPESAMPGLVGAPESAAPGPVAPGPIAPGPAASAGARAFSGPLCHLPLRTKAGAERQFTVMPDLLAVWTEAYPLVDVPGELREVRAWLVSNPSRRPASNMARFVNAWLDRAQNDQARAAARTAARAAPTAGPGPAADGGWVSPAQRRLEANMAAAEEARRLLFGPAASGGPGVSPGVSPHTTLPTEASYARV